MSGVGSCINENMFLFGIIQVQNYPLVGTKTFGRYYLYGHESKRNFVLVMFPPFKCQKIAAHLKKCLKCWEKIQIKCSAFIMFLIASEIFLSTIFVIVVLHI